jgi:hypothetical protein
MNGYIVMLIHFLICYGSGFKLCFLDSILYP